MTVDSAIKQFVKHMDEKLRNSVVLLQRSQQNLIVD